MQLQCNDTKAFLKTITSKKLTNFLTTLSAYYWSRLTKTAHHRGYPFTLSIEPTTACNLRCPECPSGLRSFTRDTGMLDASLFQKIVDETHGHLLFLYLYFQGEPYLHPHFDKLVSYACRKNIYTVTSTNAHFFNDEHARKTVESGLSRIIISIDGTTQQSYEKYRIGGNLEEVLNGAKNLVQWKKKLKSSTPHVIFQMVVFSHNENQTGELSKLAAEYGADEVRLKTAQIYDFEKGSALIPLNEKYSRYVRQSPRLTTGLTLSEGKMLSVTALSGFYRIKNPLLNHCWRMWHSCVVTWDGKVVPCCFDKDAAHVMGDLKKQSLREIWNGEAYRQFRSALLRSRREIDICTNCSEGTKVWI